MTVKYQIFVSSTYNDLIKEREQVIKAILEMGHFPVGMEMFSAADEEQWKLITNQIDQTDYYVVIIAHRYGSVVDGLSYTEKEYDYAVEKGVPVLGFIIDDSASWPTDRVDQDPKKLDALNNFKDKAKKKPVSFWSSAEELYGQCSIALMKQFTTNPRIGWVKASKVVGTDVMVELSRLSNENAVLRKTLEEALQKKEKETTERRKEIVNTLKQNKIQVKIMYEHLSKWSDPIESTLFGLFLILAPELAIEKSTENAAKLFGFMLKDANLRIRESWPVPSNTFRFWLSDLMILELITPSNRKHSVRDKREYWTLTEEGHEIYKLIRYQNLEMAHKINEDLKLEKKQKNAKTTTRKKGVKKYAKKKAVIRKRVKKKK